MDQMLDAELAALARARDRDAFGKLAERYSLMARRVVYRALSHHDAAQEIIQEAIVQATCRWTDCGTRIGSKAGCTESS